MRRLKGEICRFLVFLTLAGTPVTGLLADTLRIGGTGAGTSLLRALSPTLATLLPQDRIRLLMPPVGSMGALRALRSGAIDLAVIAQSPAAEDAALFESLLIARTPVVLASIDGLRRNGFSRSDIPALFGAEVVRWDDGRPIRMILRSTHESDTRALKTLSPEVAAAIDGALARPGATIAEHDLDALHWLERAPGTMGSTTLGLIATEKSPLRPFAIDGVIPSNEALAEGRYRVAKEVRLVWKRPAPPAVDRLVLLMQSTAGRKLLRDSGYLPETP